jgi:hypothetical protein
LSDVGVALFRLRRLREVVVVLEGIFELGRQGGTPDPAMRRATIQNMDIVRHELGDFTGSRLTLGRVVADPNAADSIVGRDPILRSRYALTLLRLGAVDSARYWIDRSLEDERILGPMWGVPARMIAAEVALQVGDRAGFDRHRTEVERLGRSLTGAARQELGYLELLALTAPTAELPRRVAAILDSSGFGPGRPRQNRLRDHLGVAAERLIAAGHFDEARRYLAALLETSSVDSLTLSRSGWVGIALSLRARAELGLGDVAAARASLRAAETPLRNGLGPRHRSVALAAALADSLGR